MTLPEPVPGINNPNLARTGWPTDRGGSLQYGVMNAWEKVPRTGGYNPKTSKPITIPRGASQ